MLTFILKRIGRGILTITLVLVLIFFLIRVAPSDAAAMLAPEEASEEEIEEIRELWGLNKPYGEQFVQYISNLLSGNAGMSYQYTSTVPIYSVTELVAARVPNTFKLAGASLLFSVVVSVLLGTLQAIKPNSFFDNLVTSVSFVANCIPGFVFGMLFILLFSTKLHWLPTSGNDSWVCIIMPAVTLSMHFIVTLTKMARNHLISFRNSSYARTLRAKGVKESKILLVHGMRNASIPLITMVGMRLGTMLGGSMVIESLFRWPGIGSLLINAVNGRDYPTVQYLVPYIAFIFVVVNLITDILYGILDPRISKVQ